MYTQSTFIHNNPKWETTQMSSNKTFMVYVIHWKIPQHLKGTNFTTAWVCLKNISGAKEVQNSTCFPILCAWDWRTGNTKLINGDQNSGCPGSGDGRIDWKKVRENLMGWWKCANSWLEWWLQGYIHSCEKFMKLYTYGKLRAFY